MPQTQCQVCRYLLVWSETARTWVRSDNGDPQCPASRDGMHRP